jgi:hypothetical protein
MSDKVTSGNAATEPAETTHAASSGDSQPDFAFGASRGSGLARGKRTSPAAPAASADPVSANYTPTVIEMINPKSEYQNPFAPVAEPAPAAPAPVAAVKPEPVAPVAPAPVASAPVAPVPVAPAPKPVADVPAPVEEPKAELKILPPTEIKHPAQSWEAPAKSDVSPRRHEERPTFKPERRERRDNPEGGRPPREGREGFKPREPREGFTPREPREKREQSASRPEGSFERERTPAAQPAKSGGFIGWLKGLFGAAPETPVEAKPSHEDSPRPQRRHRGGRGRSRNFNGPRGENNSGPRGEHGGERGGEQGGPQGDRPRRRSRGGRNRNRGGNRGDNRGGPRSEGQQGGGAI